MTDTTTKRTGLLRVDGADLYHEVRGSGRLLLILQGGDGDAGRTGDLAGRLATRHTVATYDRRGLSRSPIDDPADVPTPRTHAEDVHRLLAALTDGPALVLGSSIGALIGLQLAARHPEQLDLLIAHEPPLMRLLPEAERTEAIRGMTDAEETYRREGAAPALRAMASLVGLDIADPDLEPGVEFPAPDAAERAADLAFFFTHDLPAVRNCELDPADLAGPGRIVPAAGRMSRGIAPRRCAEELAGRLGVDLAEFPGGHSGLTMRPAAFAQRLGDVVDGAHR